MKKLIFALVAIGSIVNLQALTSGSSAYNTYYNDCIKFYGSIDQARCAGYAQTSNSSKFIAPNSTKVSESSMSEKATLR